MASSSTLENVEVERFDEAALAQYLQDECYMPPDDWWLGANVAFEKLRAILEMQSYSDEPFDDAIVTEAESITARAAKAGVFPFVAIKKIGAHLLQVTRVNEPLFCIALGNINSSRYEEIFWEKVATAKAKSKTDIIVYDARNENFELSLDGFEFKVKYLQCNDFLKSYPDVIDAPVSFLDDPANDCPSAVKALRADMSRLQHPHLDKVRKSYFYIRAWAQVRGLLGMTELSRILPKDILKVLFGYMRSEEQPLIAHDIAHYITLLNPNSPELQDLGAPPGPGSFKSTTKYCLDTLKGLQSLPLRRLMAFDYYFQIQIIFTCSGMKGGQWVSMLQERLCALPEIGFNPKHKYRVWPSRLAAADGASNSVYEGFYIIGVEAPDVMISGTSFRDILNKWKLRVEKDKRCVQGECFVHIEEKQASDFDTVFKVCHRRWPRKPFLDPSEKNSATLSADFENPLPIRSKKVHKDGRKHTDVPTPPQVQPSTKLRQASEVLSRLKHDPSFDIDEYMVGYEDRHTPQPQEKPAESWQRDTTHEEFIPEHRIIYFKRIRKGTADEIVWDRRYKVDLIFKEDKQAEEGRT